MIIGKRIRAVRDSLDLNGEEFGKLLSVTKVAVSNWENENRTPDAEMIVKIAALGNVTTDYLLGTTDEPSKPEIKEPLGPELEELLQSLKDIPPELINDFKTFINTMKKNYKLVDTEIANEKVTYIVDTAKKPNGLTKEEELEAYNIVKELEKIEKNKGK